MRALLVLLSLCISNSAGDKVIHSFAGPFITYVDVMHMCPPHMRNPCWHAYYRLSHFNPTRPFDKQHLWGNMTTCVSCNDTMLGQIVMDVRAQNQWKVNAFIFKYPRACTIFKNNIPDFFRKAHPTAALKGPCIISPGTHVVIPNATIDWSSPRFPIFPYGHYRFTITMGPSKARMPFFCLVAEVHAVPKPL